MKEKSNIAEHEVPEPKALASCIEFQVDSQSPDPSFSGIIEVRTEPERFGIRWHGEKIWTWLEWHELLGLGRNWSATFRELVAEEKEVARTAAMKEVIELIHTRPVGDWLPVYDARRERPHLVRRSPLTKHNLPPDGAA